MNAPAPICPKCGSEARGTETQYGKRFSCCGLHSWDGKPLVSQAVHDARQRCHAAFDPIWKHAETAYTISERKGSWQYERALKRIRKSMRNRAYQYIAHVTGFSEPECHMSEQTDLGKLAAIEAAAKQASPQIVRDWFKTLVAA